MQYFWIIFGIIILYAIAFQVIMVYVVGQTHSWITSFYWVMTMMTTLGLGDITFTSDIGRLFTMLVVTTGVVLLLILLPFMFIRFGPWLENRVQVRPPSRVPLGTKNHVIITSYEEVMTPGILRRLRQENVPCYIIQSDPILASQQFVEGLPVILGRSDSTGTYEALHIRDARLVVANEEETVNTNSILTIRELAPDVQIAAVATSDDAIDVLQLSGASHVLPLKRWLGEQLANRINASRAQLHTVGKFKDLLIAELPVHHTPLANKTLRDTRLRELTGVSVIGVWEDGKLQPAMANMQLNQTHVLVVAGRQDQLDELDSLMLIYDINTNPVIVIGGGTVGISATRTLKKKDVPVHMVERNPALRQRLKGICDQVFIGDGADYALLHEAGLAETPSVLISTNDDAMNIYLTSYCRHLNDDLRIVSRITHERNLDAIHRAGANLVLRYSTLGSEAIYAILANRELMLLGEGINLFSAKAPRALRGSTLAASGIGAKIGVIVLAIENNNHFITNPPPNTLIDATSILHMLGNEDQRDAFNLMFG